MKTFAAALLATATAFQMKEKVNVVKSKLASLLHLENEVASNSMVISQTDAMINFIMDPSQTYGNPDPVTPGVTETFYIGGIWLAPAHLQNMNFKCHMFGALVYNENTLIDEDMEAGSFWTTTIPFDVPSVTPHTNYNIDVAALDASDNELFHLIT